MPTLTDFRFTDIRPTGVRPTDFREAIETDARDLRLLASRIDEAVGDAGSSAMDEAGIDSLCGIAGSSSDFFRQERRLDDAAWSLRRHWLRLAHRPADRTPKSPCSGQSAQLASGRDVRFGYERDLDVSALESRRQRYMKAVDGWSSELVVFRSGQAALAGLLQLAAGRWDADGPLTVAHRGAYFETKALLEAWPHRIFRRSPPHRDIAPDVAILEPVWCDGAFGRSSGGAAPRRLLLLDTTMVGPAYDLAPYLDGRCSLVVAFSSGLKLDQAGLELANVGMVRIHARAGAEDATEIADGLRRLRGLTGTGLTLDELSALSAPWFLDRAYASHYTRAIFDNNRALALAVGNASPLFDECCHPCLGNSSEDRAADAPFCAIRLREPSSARYAQLLRTVEAEIDRRGLLAGNGGSFGFRGHRFELIEPPPGEGDTFLRVALGWRDGHSRAGLCELFAELSATGMDDTKHWRS